MAPLNPPGVPGDVRELLVENRDFRRLFAGHVVSLAGDALYSVAAMWLVWSLTGSTYYTGLAGVLTRAPRALQALTGPIVDRAGLGRILVLSEAIQGAVVLVVPLAALAGRLDVRVVLVAIGLLAVANQFANPAQVAAIPRLVGERLLVRANSLGSVAGRAADTVANAAAGAIVAAVGAVALFAIDAATFAVAGGLFLTLHIPGANTRTDDGREAGAGRLRRYLADLTEGVDLIAGSVLRHLLFASLLANFLAGMAVAVLPAFADALAGAAVYGALVAARNAGRFVGAVSAPWVEGFPFGRIAAAGFGAAGVVWIGAVAAGTPWVTVALIGIASVAAGAYNVLVGAAVQTGVPDDLLGRVRAAIGSAQGIVGPLGLFAGGVLGEVIPIETVIAATGVGYLLVAGYYLAVPTLWQFPPPIEVTPGGFDVR